MHTWHTVVHIHAHTGLHVQVCIIFSKNLFSLHLFSLSSLNKSARSRRAIFFFRIRSHARFSPGTSPPPPNPLPPLLPPSTVMCSWTILRFGISAVLVLLCSLSIDLRNFNADNCVQFLEWIRACLICWIQRINCPPPRSSLSCLLAHHS